MQSLLQGESNYLASSRSAHLRSELLGGAPSAQSLHREADPSPSSILSLKQRLNHEQNLLNCSLERRD